MELDELMVMREGMARHHGFALYEQYSEPQAAALLKVNLSTIKDWREKGYVDCVSLGERHYRYNGYQIADAMLFGNNWRERPEPNFPTQEKPERKTAHPKAHELARKMLGRKT